MSTSDGEPEWCLIESDPGVFTELLEQLGCTSVELQELWSVDEDDTATSTTFADTKAVYGLVFLFQWQKEFQHDHAANVMSEIPPALFFATQVTTNACATQALLSVVLNAPTLTLGSTLQEFQQFSADFPPALKGIAIAGSEDLRKAHNSFARRDAFLTEKDDHDDQDKSKGEAFHFVAYVPFQGSVYELDGLLPGPIQVGTIPENTEDPLAWLPVGFAAIRERMATLGGSVKFNLMAVVHDQREGADPATLERELSKREQWKLENERRRHNYVPLIVQLLKELAAADQLDGLVQAAKEKRLEKVRAALEKKS